MKLMRAPKFLRPFFSYFGSKWGLAPRYPAPHHARIIEPFAGSAGYALRHYQRRVILNERDPVVAGVWRYLLKVKEMEILTLPDVPRGGLVDALPIPQEAQWLIGFWFIGGLAKPRKREPSTPLQQRRLRCWGTKARQRIAQQLRYIRHWELREGDYSELPDIEATWFIDPPYQARALGQNYTCGSSQLDFSALGEWCKQRMGQAIVCDQVGADWLPFELFEGVTGARMNTSSEAIWLGGQR